MPKLAHSLNQPVVIAAPSYFGDAAPRRVILVDIEVSGLWFSGEALHAPLVRHGLTTPPEDAVATVFFPFEQIAYVFDPRQFARLPRGLSATGRSVMHPAQPPARPEKGEVKRPSGGRPSPKEPKRKR